MDSTTTDGSVAGTQQQTADQLHNSQAGQIAQTVPIATQQENSVSPTDHHQVQQINREFQEKSVLKDAKERGLPYINLSKTPLNPDFLKIIPLELAKEARIIAFFRVGKSLRVAVENPENSSTEKAIQTLKEQGYDVSVSLTSSTGVDDALNHYMQAVQYEKIELIDQVDKDSVETYEKEIANLKNLPAELEKVTAEEALNLLNVAAMKTGASDLHLEPEEDKVVVRMRIDGVLYRVFELETPLYQNIANQLKYQSKMTLNVATIPQDGRFEFKYNDQNVAVRTASIPTPHHEAFVCRYLASGKKTLTFEELGFTDLALTKIQNAAKISHGMVLVTGPTGSGKSTTLYSMLSVMNTPTNKTITLEDPVEYHLNGVTQSQIDEKNGYTFTTGLRSVLRHDPDVVMLGEIRDLDTAQTAVQASLTGHVLLSTLHTNSAIESIPRLINMGLPPFMVAPALHTVVGQRLVRKVCPDCVSYEPLTDSEKKEFEEVVKNLKNINPHAEIEVPGKIPRVHECDKCSKTGYKGRLVITEVITVSAEMKRMILEESSSVDLIAAARKEGINTMREDGFVKVARGLTTLEEVYRATNVG